MLSVLFSAALPLLAAVLVSWRAARSRGGARLYWAACALLLWGGIAGVAAVIMFPPERFDDAGHLIGEMPPEFGAALALGTLGLLGAVAGFLVTAVMRLRR